MLKNGIFRLLKEMVCRCRQCFPREGEGRIYTASSELEKSTPLCSSSLIEDMFQSETSLLLAKVELSIDWLILRHSAVRSSFTIHTGSEALPHNICEHLPIIDCYAGPVRLCTTARSGASDAAKQRLF